MKKKLTVLLCLMCFLALVLAGCGGNNDDGGGNIFIQQPKNVLNLYGGTIKNGQAVTGPDVYANDGAIVNIVKVNAGVTVVQGRDSTNATAIEGGIEKTLVKTADKDSSINVTENNGVFTVSAVGAGGFTPSKPNKTGYSCFICK